MPPRATGTLTYSDNGTPLVKIPIFRSDYAPVYEALGDSITAGAGLTWPERYPDRFAAANGFEYYLNFGIPGDFACDTLANRILPNQVGATQDVSPLYSLMIGTNDMDNLGVPFGENNFHTCHLAALAWLGVPREYKVLPGDPGAVVLSGAWALPPAVFDSTYGTLYNTSGAGAASFNVTSNGGPLYLWYLIGDHLSGSFTVSLDGVPTGTTYTTQPPTIIGSHNSPYQTGFSLIRLPVQPGPHSLRVDITSGTVGILGAATPASPGSASAHPTVLATDVPNQNPLLAQATPAFIQQYTLDAFADDTLLQGDGLDIRTVTTHTFLTADPSEFFDFGHPDVVGDQNLEAALQAAFGTTSTAPYFAYTQSNPIKQTVLDTAGKHVLTVDYSGDAFYAPSTSSTDVTVVAGGQSITTLTAAATTFRYADPIILSGSVFPAKPGQSLTLMEGQQTLASAVLGTNTAAFSLPGLAPGPHTLYAAYGGDASNAASVSPPLAIQVSQNTSAITLTQPAAELAYAAPLTLSAAVTPATASGNVLFTDSWTPIGQVSAQAVQTLGQATLTAGAASFPLPALAPGTHTFTALYSGDTDDTAATSAPAATLIDPIPTATTLAATPAAFGQLSTFTATVLPATSTGTITLTDSLSSSPVQATLQNGTATWTSTTLIPGTHIITAAYAGDSTHAASTSPSLAATIARDPSTLTLTAPAAPLYAGHALTLTAAITPATATGTLLFSDPTAGVLGQATLASGLATLTLPSLPPGTYTVTATYAGDSNSLPTTSSSATLQVLSTSTVTTLAAPATALYTAPITLSASVSPVPTGALLRFLDNGTLLGTVALTSSTATFTTASLTPGVHTLTATFPGDSTHNPSTGTATLTIAADPSTTTLTLAQPSLLAGSPAVVTVRVATSTTTIPTGTVILRTGAVLVATATLGNGAAGASYATVSIPTSAAGTFPVTAFYSGDPTSGASDSSSLAVAYTVSPRIAAGTLTLSATQVPPQTPVTLTAAFTSPAASSPAAGSALIPTGSVTFLQGTTTLATVPLDATGHAAFTPPAETLGTWIFTAVYNPTGVFTAAPVAPATLTVTPPLALAFTTSTLTLAPGATADAPVTFTTLSGYQGSVTTQCTTPQPYLTCTVDAPLTLTGSTTGKVHLAVARQTGALNFPGTRTGTGIGTATTTATLTLALLLPFCSRRRRRRLPTLLTFVLAAVLATTLTGCAQGGTFGNVPSGTFLIQLTATAANTPTTATLTVNVQ